ncbi:MAG: hypothetical protein KDE54_30985 [Caldilineaceae bacterium]|nr:hypothetical protein [Caldilineaceae bacterium]
MANTAENTIVLGLNENGSERPIFDDMLASATVTPGEFLAISSGALIPHGTAAGTNVLRLVAVQPWAKTVAGTKGIDTTYASGDRVRYVMPQRGDSVYAFLEAGANVAKGAPLESGAAGNLQASTTGDVLAYAKEAVNNSGGGTRVRIRVWVA